MFSSLKTRFLSPSPHPIATAIRQKCENDENAQNQLILNASSILRTQKCDKKVTSQRLQNDLLSNHPPEEAPKD
jgi:hypothetical protein